MLYTPPYLAYDRIKGKEPGILFLTGFRSDRKGGKATAIAEWAARIGRACLRFDYSGHGDSGGKFEDGCIGDWLQDALYMFDHHTTGPQIVVGSSMGGWIMLHLALQRPDRVAGLLGIAAAPDFTEELIWNPATPQAREKLLRDGVIYEESEYGTPTPITRKLIEDGRRHLLLNRGKLPIRCPMRLLHGVQDRDVPWQFSERILQTVESGNTQLTLIEDGDHRLSRPQDLEKIISTLATL